MRKHHQRSKRNRLTRVTLWILSNPETAAFAFAIWALAIALLIIDLRHEGTPC